METFKQFMSFPMFATVVWLTSVFASTTGRTGTTLLLFALTLIAMILWIYGRFFQRPASKRSRTLAALTAAICLAGSVWLIADANREKAPVTNATGHGMPLSAKDIVERRENGLITVVDVWAEWCLQCETNRKLAFDRDEFRQALQRYDAVFMLGDKTHENSPADRTAQKFVEAYQSGGIPLAFIVPAKGPVIQLPVAIGSPGLLIEALEQAKQQSK
jgi:thiol:disulfide interchange protein DsbD